MKQPAGSDDEFRGRVDVDGPQTRFEGDGPLAAVLARWDAESLREELETTAARAARREEQMRTTTHALGVLGKRVLPGSILTALKRLLGR